MKRSKKTKKALTGSVLALVLCFVMLLGTTFAWFTDTASTGVNSVVSGTLDVVLQKLTDDGNWANIDKDETLYFLDGDRNDYWEPGCTYTLPDVKIVNNGSLALKYRVKVTAASGDNKLAEVLEVYLKDGAMTYDLTTNPYGAYVGTLAELLAKQNSIVATDKVLKAQGKTEALTISLHMKESAGNEYKDLSIDGITLTVEAGQATVEYDSTTNQYDKDAIYAEDYGLKWSGNVGTMPEPDEDGVYHITTPEELAAFAESVNNGNSYHGKTVKLEADFDLDNKPWTPIGTIDHYFAGNFDGQNHTISNLKVNGGVSSPIDAAADGQGLFGSLNARGDMAYIQNLNIHNADVCGRNSVGAFVGCFDTYTHQQLSGQANIWNCKLTGKVTIKGGNSGGIAGSPVDHWCMLASLQNITIDADAGSYITNVGVGGASGTVGGVTAVTVYSSGCSNITSNLDVIANAGTVGGVVGIAGGSWSNVKTTGDVTIQGVDPDNVYSGSYGLAIGSMVTAQYGWFGQTRLNVDSDTVTSTGSLTLNLTNGTTVTTNGEASNAIGRTLW